MVQKKRFSIDELSDLSGITQRNIRYYIQEELVDKPEGLGRGAHYSDAHLQQLLTIKRMREEEGISLEKIKERWSGGLPGEAQAQEEMPGTQRVWQRLTLATGLELNICPELSGLTQDELGSLYRTVQKELTRLQRSRKEKP